MPPGNHTFTYARISAGAAILAIALGTGCASKEEVTQRLKAETEKVAKSRADTLEVMGPMPDTALFGTDTASAVSATAR